MIIIKSQIHTDKGLESKNGLAWGKWDYTTFTILNRVNIFVVVLTRVCYHHDGIKDA